MSVLTLANFRAAARSVDGQELATLRRRDYFAVRLLPDGSGLEYTPRSSGKARKQTWQYVEKVIALYNETLSLRPGDYKDITNHASYTLTIIDLARRGGEGGRTPGPASDPRTRDRDA
jgi:hypothetical protein